MKAVIQRVSEGSVTVDGKVVAEIGQGLVILLGIAPEDTVVLAKQWWIRSLICGFRG